MVSKQTLGPRQMFRLNVHLLYEACRANNTMKKGAGSDGKVTFGTTIPTIDVRQ